jgi:hypothetical protein
MNLNDQHRKAFYALLAEAKSLDPEQAEDMARTILLADLDKVEAEIRNELVRIQGQQQRDMDQWQRHYYIFLAPLAAGEDKPKLVNATKDIDYYERPQRQGYKVQLRHLKAFCKEQGLKEKEMVKVGEGDIYEHRGWIRKPGLGPTMLLGREWREPMPEVDMTRPAEGRKENRFLFRYALPDQDWTPNQDK